MATRDTGGEEIITAAPDPVSIGEVNLSAGPAPTEPYRIQGELIAAVDAIDLVSSVVVGPDHLVHVLLHAGRDAVADSIVSRFGEAVSVSVGPYRWPLGSKPSLPAECGTPVPEPDPEATVTAILTLDSTEVGFGNQVTGTVIVHNQGTSPATFNQIGAAYRGILTLPEAALAINAGSFVSLPTLRTTVVPAGRSSGPMPVVFGSTSCAPHLGTAIQPGHYSATVVLASMEGAQVVADAVEVSVSPPR